MTALFHRLYSVPYTIACCSWLSVLNMSNHLVECMFYALCCKTVPLPFS